MFATSSPVVRTLVASPLFWVSAQVLAGGIDLPGLDDHHPAVQFDMPRQLVVRDVTPTDFAAARPQERIVQLDIPVSFRVLEGEVGRVREMVIEVDAAWGQAAVFDFAPRTTLTSDVVDRIATTTTSERTRSLEATLGGQLPAGAGGAAKVTPSIGGEGTNREVNTQTIQRLPPQQAVVVSGTQQQGRGVFFQFRPSTQSTLEGQHRVLVELVVPKSWQGGQVNVRCLARGQKKVLWVDQAAVWGSAAGRVEVALLTVDGTPEKLAATPITHTTAKAIVVAESEPAVAVATDRE